MNRSNASKNNGHLQKNTYTCRILLFISINLMVITFSLFCFYFKNTRNLDILSYPANSQGQSCYIKYKDSYPILYIDLTLSTPRYRCVNQCPRKSNSFTIMDSNGQSFLFPAIGEELNQQFGGICWSSQKENLLKQRGLFMEFQSKSIILNKFTSIYYLCVVAFFLGTASAIVFYCFTSRIFYYLVIIRSFVLLGYFICYIAKSNFLLYKKEVITFIGLTLFFYILNLLAFKKRLEDSIRFSQQVKNQFQNSAQSSVSKFFKCLSLSTVFSIIHCFLLLLILYEYIGIVSTEKLVKKQNEVYYNINRTWWKYLVLLCHWLLLSNLLEKTYQFLMTKLGYRLIMKQHIGSICFTLPDLLNIYVFAFIQTILWIPLKIILIVKPEGSIVRKNEKETFCQIISRCCFCCCGLAINYLHKFTVNPYLVLALQPTFDDLDSSLALVQQVYHKHDPSYDKTSLWLSRLSNYISVSIMSACLVQFLAKQQNSSAFSNLFIVFSVVVAIQIGQYNSAMWGLLSEITQFVQLVGAKKNRDIIL